MSAIARLRSLARGIFGRAGVESAMDEELRFHREQYAADLVRRGVSAPEAEARAAREFGAIEPLKEECRQARGLRLLDETAQDLRYAARTLRRSPGFAAASILTLAIGIGANTAIFTIVDRRVLRPLPYPDGERIVVVSTLDRKTGERTGVSKADFYDWQRASAFDRMAAWNTTSITLTGSGEAEAVRGVVAQSGFLPMFGAHAQLGRDLTPQDETPGAPRAALITAGLWRRRFGGAREAIGQTMQVDGTAVAIVGVLPEDFHLPLAGNADVWLPMTAKPALAADRRAMQWNAMAHLHRGVSFARAQETMKAVAGRLAAQYPETNRDRSVAIRTLRDEIGRFAGNEQALAVFGLVGCLLLIACFNVANLQVGRAIARQKEIAVRLGIGAGRARIMRQLATENVALFLVGALASVAVAVATTRWLVDAIPPTVRQYLPNRANLTVDGRALLYTLAIGVATGVIFGLAPALHCRRLDVSRGLKEGAIASPGGRLRRALVVAEVALAALVLVSAALLGGSLVRMRTGDPGFETRGLTTAAVFYSRQRIAENKPPDAFFGEAVARLAAQPGVVAAGAATQVPFLDGGDSFRYRIVGRPQTAQQRAAAISIVTPGYFRTLGVPLLRGRDFSEADAAGQPFAAVINQTMARTEWPSADPVGARFAIGPDFQRVFTVVGVVRDTQGLNDSDLPQPEFFVSYHQLPWRFMTLVARTASPEHNAGDAIRSAVREADPIQAITMLLTMDQAMTAHRAPSIVVGQLTTCFAAVALLLAAIGIYGVTAYSVNARRKEFGIRMALGAASGDVTRLILRQAMTLAVAGLAIGLAGALAVTRFLTSLLYHVRPTDPPSFLGAALVLAAIAAAACYLPARRAVKADPTQALREE